MIVGHVNQKVWNHLMDFQRIKMKNEKWKIKNQELKKIKKSKIDYKSIQISKIENHAGFCKYSRRNINVFLEL